VANNLAQALKDLNDSWTLKMLIASKKKTAGISRTICNSHLIPPQEHIYIYAKINGKVLVVDDEDSISNSGATLGFGVGSIVVENGLVEKNCAGINVQIQD
jgi:hypothetical protein